MSGTACTRPGLTHAAQTAERLGFTTVWAADRIIIPWKIETDYAYSWSNSFIVPPEKPFLVYYVPGGTHSPHHPTPEWTKKISDMHLFDGGWNKLRETIFANQKRLVT